ncbi:hypothetical protein ABKW33_02225 [Sanguibacter sp. 26GB23]
MPADDYAGSQEILAPDISSSRVAPTSIDPAGYWTPEKLANAIPMDLIATDEDGAEARSGQTTEPLVEEPGTIVDPVAPTVESYDSRAFPPVKHVPKTAGKIFYHLDGKDYVCSGATVNHANKNMIVTAAHCLYTPGKGWHSKIVFIPAYYNGSQPHGLWNWKGGRTHNAWIQDENWSYDQAFITFFPRNGVELVEKVGGNGVSYGYSTTEPEMRVFGWPAQAPYDGELPYYCEGPTTDFSPLNSDAKIACLMNEGASGGPWLRQIINDDLGYVSAVTSRKTLSGSPRYLVATPFTMETRAMYYEMT